MARSEILCTVCSHNVETTLNLKASNLIVNVGWEMRGYILYVFFWVFPRRPIVVCRRFGTLYQFHLQGLDVKYEVIHTLHPALEDGTDTGYRNVGKPQSDAGEIPKRIHIRFKTWRKFEIKGIYYPYTTSVKLDKLLSYKEWRRWEKKNSWVRYLTLILLTWRIWWAPNNASKWQMGIKSVFKGLTSKLSGIPVAHDKESRSDDW